MSGSFLPPHFREDEALPRLEIHLSPVRPVSLPLLTFLVTIVPSKMEYLS